MEFYNKYKHLIYSLISFVVGISIIIKQDNKNLIGFIILSISFGYLLTYIALGIKNQKLRKLLNYLSYLIPILCVVYAIFNWVINN